MTCHHAKGDPNCGAAAREAAASEMRRERAEKERELQALRARLPPTPDARNYTIEEVAQTGPNLVLRVKYPNCAKCAYEGNKVLVFLAVSTAEALRWRVIDPHFRDPKMARKPTEAPPPDARFPANDQGWDDAIEYATRRRA